MTTPCTRTAGPGVMKVSNLADPSLVIISIYIVCVTVLMHWGREDFYRNYGFSLFDLYGRALVQELLPRGQESYNFGITLPWSSLLYT